MPDALKKARDGDVLYIDAGVWSGEYNDLSNIAVIDIRKSVRLVGYPGVDKEQVRGQIERMETGECTREYYRMREKEDRNEYSTIYTFLRKVALIA